MMKMAWFVCLLLFTGLFASGQTKHAVRSDKNVSESPVKIQPVYYLEMEGLLFIGNSKARANVTVYKDSTIFLNTESEKRSGKCKFQLPLDGDYVVELSKDGHVSKKIRINTKVPEVRKRKNFEFRFEADLFESIPGLNVTVLQKPVAEVKYSDGFDSFIYDVEYTSKVNKDLKKLYQDYYLLQKTVDETIITPVNAEGATNQKDK